MKWWDPKMETWETNHLTGTCVLSVVLLTMICYTLSSQVILWQVNESIENGEVASLNDTINTNNYKAQLKVLWY